MYDRIDKAWQILSNDESRRKYNRQIKGTVVSDYTLHITIT